MGFDYAAGAVGGDDDKTVMLAWLLFADRILANRRTEDWRPVSVADQVGLLFGAAFINPLKPVVDRDDGPVRPDGFEKRPWATYSTRALIGAARSLAQCGRHPSTISARRYSPSR